MESSLRDFEKSFIRRTLVSPQWLSGGDSVFWYKRETGLGKFQFITVNCEKGTRTPAFDHARLAHELGKRTKEQIDPCSLPFWWINLDDNATWVRFQYNGQTWQYTRDRGLEQWQGHFDEGNFDLGCEEVASPWSRQQATVILTNQSAERIEYYWIGNEGVPRLCGGVHPGESKAVNSYLGHRWRLTEPVSGKSVVCELKDLHSTAFIDEIPLGLTLRWEWDQKTKDSVRAGTESVPGTFSELFLQEFNVWGRYSSNGTEKQITYDGVEDNAFKDIYLSHSGNHAVAFQCKPPANSLAFLINSSPEDQFPPKLIREHYLRAGDNMEHMRPRLLDLAKDKEIFVDNELFQSAYALTHIGWSEDSQKYRFIFNERGHQHLKLLEIDTGGIVSTLVQEHSETFVDYNQKLYYKLLASTNELLWASERDGWNHLYLFNLDDGILKNQVTKGAWVMRSVEHIDEANRRIWFKGLGMVREQDPYYAHLACVAFDGSGLRIITKGDGTHTWKWGPNRRFIVDTWSRVDCIPRSSVREAVTGREAVSLQSDALNPALERTWVRPERFTAFGRDAKTKIYGIIIRPNNFDESQRYPIIEHIYAGPQGFCTPKAFKDLSRLRRVADQGYIVVCADGMGTNWRSKAFHDFCYKDLKDGGFADRIAWIRAAAKSRPWMDLTRVGCYGSSAGGQNAAAAVIHHSDFYKAASSMAGCHDNRMGQLLWNEMWMGYPVDGSYEECSNITHAQRLGGALMLVVGGLDNNVDPATTLRFADALVKADKDFDMVFVPGGTHYVDEMPFVMRKQDAFFRKHLQEC
ncbi:hypothetical protein HIM_05449 [Hirsutella minnesotensis 3608]|uniref:Probable dipeptidyl-aminopeptidase B n=1 Tax=Hirsutella minnesotensis 3608 TaxID=1043627 RepID=A0A0F7ZPC4_9HYPO|nr:hypothetical protein HIM_05449 [Hirsutella minnesotensis 3608]